MDVISSSAQGDSAPAAQQTNELTKFSLNPAQADCLFKSLQIAYGLSLSIIYILIGSAIIGFLWNGAGMFKINLGKLIGKNLDMSFMLDSLQINVFSLFKNRKIYVSDHPELSLYELTDRQTTVSLPKCSGRSKAPTIPGFTEEEKVGAHVSIKEFKKLKSAAQSSYPPYSILRLYSHQLITIQLPGLAPYVVDPAAYRERKGEPDLSLKSFSLMMVPAEEIQLRLFRRESAYWMNAEAEIAIGTTIELFEQVFPLQR